MNAFIVYSIIILAALGIAFMLLRILSDSKRYDEHMRLAFLIERAKKEFPAARLTDSLDMLYESIYKELVMLKREGKSGDEIFALIEDQMLIANERLRLWRNEIEERQRGIERDSGFNILHSAQL